MSEAEVAKSLDGFFGTEYVHWSGDAANLQAIPRHIRELYLQVQVSGWTA